ncbi:MAG: insulinase family protein [Bacilli bacterium]|nr:insulinase family protein [Bacilli bacterium]
MEHLMIQTTPTTLLPTKQFKTVSIYIVFIGSFNRQSATSRLLLNRLLSSSTEKYATKKQVNDMLLGMYDAYFNITSFSMYETLFTVFEMEVVDPLFIESNVVADAIAFLKEVIFHPHLENYAFPKKEFEEEKRMIRDQIINLYNNKTLYSTIRLLELIAKDEVMMISPSGNLEVLKAITSEQLYKDYLQLLQEEARIYVVGDVDSSIGDAFGDFHLQGKEGVHLYYGKPQFRKPEAQFVTEEQEISQSRLLMGFDTNVFHQSPDVYTMIVLNTMLGGMATSSLFTIIREQNSLAYQVDSSVSFEFGLLVVSCGIDAAKQEAVSSMVMKIMTSYQEGSLDPVLLQMAKDNLTNSLKEAQDRPGDLFQIILRQELLHQPPVMEFIDRIQAVRIEDIKRLSGQITLHTTYFLKGVGPTYEKN